MSQVADLPQRVIENFIRYRNDPWLFLIECVYTLDPVDEKNPIKLYPNKDYLKFFVRVWQTEKLLAVPKSRRMTMSWTALGLEIWSVIFHKGKNTAIVSKKETDAAELVQKMEFIYKHIPTDKIPRELLPALDNGKMRADPPALKFSEIYSKIQGYAMTPDQLRQFTFSSIVGDECAFWQNGEDFYAASKPTTDGGGRITLISSVAPGFFKKVCYDTLDSDLDREDPPEGAKIMTPMTGLRIWRNPKNRFLVFDLDSTADPAKRSKEFEEGVKAGMPYRQYLQEYKRIWDTYDGMAVYGDFSSQLHLTEFNLEPEIGLPLLVAWDFGLTPAAVVGQLVGKQLRIFREFTAKNQSIITFAPEVMSQLRTLYPEWLDADRDFRHYIDPAGFKKAETDSRTCAGVMRSAAGITRIQPGAPLDNNWESRKQAVEKRLITRTKEGPAILIKGSDCPLIKKGFLGGYRYPESAGSVESKTPMPIKDKHSHPHDALQYLCGGAQSLERERPIPETEIPQYSFTQERN